jgi:hypothetical protein
MGGNFVCQNNVPNQKAPGISSWSFIFSPLPFAFSDLNLDLGLSLNFRSYNW